MRCALSSTIVVVIVAATVATAQVIQKWKTANGSLYFGDKPPPGSTKIGEEGSPAPAPMTEPSNNAAAAQPAPSDDGFSVQVSNARNHIAEWLNKDSARLAEIHDRIEKVRSTQLQGDPYTVASQSDVTEIANLQSRKDQALNDLRAEERKTYADIAGLWRAFDDLHAQVLQHYGREPDWWRSRIDCRDCPSRLEAENALR